MAGARLQTLVIDEDFGSQDAAGRERVQAVLQSHLRVGARLQDRGMVCNSRASSAMNTLSALPATLSADRKEVIVLTARDELRLLAERLPESVIEELAAIARVLEQQTRCGDIEDVTDPEEDAIVREALLDDGNEVEYTLQEAKDELAALRRARRA